MRVSRDSLSRWLTATISGLHGDGQQLPATRLGDVAVAGAAVFERVRSTGRLVAPQGVPTPS